ncbi:MAG: alpha/beta fold hydrolase, partial [Acetobacteraceae bacterium]
SAVARMIPAGMPRSTPASPTRRAALATLGLAAGLAGGACAPRLVRPGPALAAPADAGDALVMPDGARLPLAVWPAEGEARGALLALHGFNDYRRAFEIPAPLFTQAGWSLYAYDQRGFGAAPHPGLWAGHEAMAADAAHAARLIRARAPGVPLVLLGESMGAAVLILAGASDDPPDADAYVLSAPAVWGGETMGAVGRAMLSVLAHTVPALGFANTSPFHRASDNEAALVAMGRDPLVLKSTRVDAIYGLMRLMDAALAASARFRPRALVLYGGRDDLVPPRAIRAMADRLPGLGDGRQRMIVFPDGHHLLLRDSIRERVAGEVLAWLDAAGVGAGPARSATPGLAGSH